MYYIPELLGFRRKSKFTMCWLAATFGKKKFKQRYNSSSIKEADVPSICEEIVQYNESFRRFNLYSMAQLAYGVVKIYSYQIDLFEQEAENAMKLLYPERRRTEPDLNIDTVLDLPVLPTTREDIINAQLHENLHILRDEPNIDRRVQTLMQCMDFGALTNEELDLIFQNEEAILLGEFDRIHMSPSKTTSFSVSVLPLPQEATKEILKYEKDIEQQVLLREHIRRQEEVYFDNELTQKMEPPQARQSTPTKRILPEDTFGTPKKKKSRLTIQQTVDQNEIAVISDVEQLSQLFSKLEPLDKIQMQRKKRKSRNLLDRYKTQLDSNIMRSWIKRVNIWTTPRCTVRNEIPKVDVFKLLKTPSKSMVVFQEKLWNKSLYALFQMHISKPLKKPFKPVENTQTEVQIERTKEIIRTTEMTKLGDPTIELSSNLVRQAEITGREQTWDRTVGDMSAKQQCDVQERIKLTELVEENVGVKEEKFKEQYVFDNQPNSAVLRTRKLKTTESLNSSSSQLERITKQELYAMLEVFWRDEPSIKFSDLLPVTSYTKDDVACAFLFLLELFKEEKIILRQSGSHDPLWILKHPSSDSSSST